MAGKIVSSDVWEEPSATPGGIFFPARSQPDFLPFSLLPLSHLFPLLLVPSFLFSPRSAPFAFIRQQAVRHRFDRSALPFLRSFFASLFLRRTAFLLLAPYSLSPFSFPFPALVTSLPPLLRPLLSALFSAHLHRPLFRLFRSLPVTQKTWLLSKKIYIYNKSYY